MALHQRRKSSIEKTAIEMLNEHDLLAPGFDIEILIKQLGIRLIEEKLDENISGYSAIKNNVRVIAVNEGHGNERKRFTMAHELGHLTLHNFSEFNFSEHQRTFFRNNVSSSGLDNFEVEANCFAASLLMPKDLILREFNESGTSFLFDEAEITNLSSRFKVSEKAMAIRLTTLGLINL